MKIITISREFGSGGREIGKRLADLLGFDYYDREIIVEIAKNRNLDENYVEEVLENKNWHNFPLTYSRSFTLNNPQISMLTEQKKVVEKIANLNRDCVIVGRNSDVILEDKNPFKIFVYASKDAKIERIKTRMNENTSLKEIEKQIQRIDKNRRRTHELLSDIPWGNPRGYNLCIDTSNWDIKNLSLALKEFIKCYWEGKNED